MQITLGKLKPDEAKASRLIAEGWTRLKEPGDIVQAMVLSVPLMVANMLITAGLIRLVAPAALNQLIGLALSPFSSTSFNVELNLLEVGLGILSLALLMLIHELLHLVFVPNFPRSDKTRLGLTYAGAYVVTEEIMTRKRFGLIGLGPFVIVSLALPLILGLAGLLSPGLIVLALLNAMGSSVDIMGLLFMITQVPRGSVLRCCGWNTFWREDAPGKN